MGRASAALATVMASPAYRASASQRLIALGCLLLHDKNRIGLHQMSPFVPDPLK